MSKRNRKMPHEVKSNSELPKGSQWWIVYRAELEDDDDDDDDDEDNETQTETHVTPTSPTPVSSPVSLEQSPASPLSQTLSMSSPGSPSDHTKVKRTKSKSKKIETVSHPEVGDNPSSSPISGNTISREDSANSLSDSDSQLQRSKSRKKATLIRVVKKFKEGHDQEDT